MKIGCQAKLECTDIAEGFVQFQLIFPSILERILRHSALLGKNLARWRVVHVLLNQLHIIFPAQSQLADKSPCVFEI